MNEHGAATKGAAANELHVNRTFDAPRELVFRCMIDPDHLTHFWGPTGVRAPPGAHHRRRCGPAGCSRP